MKEMNEDNMLLTPVVLQQYFQDLSSILIELHSKNMELTDRFWSEPTEIWVPSNHDFILIRNRITSMDYENEVSTTLNTMLRRTQLNQSILNKLTFPEIENKLKEEIKYLLYLMNYHQERYGDFYFISPLVPTEKEIKDNESKFKDKIYDALEHKLLPQIADTMFDDEMSFNEVYSIKLSDPLISFSDSPIDKTSFLSLNIDVIDRNLESIINNSITLDFNYSDSSKFAWIYANDSNNFEEISMEQYIQWTNEAIEKLVNNKQVLKYGKVSLLLADYNGLSARDQFVNDNSNDIDNDTINLFIDMQSKGEFNDFIDSISPLNSNSEAYRVKCKTSNPNSPLTLFVGPGGISSAEYGPLYGVNKDLGSIKDASRKLSTLLGFNTNQIPAFTSLYDKRRIKKLVNNNLKQISNKVGE